MHIIIVLIIGLQNSVKYKKKKEKKEFLYVKEKFYTRSKQKNIFSPMIILINAKI